jgi:hypothetical protein
MIRQKVAVGQVLCGQGNLSATDAAKVLVVVFFCLVFSQGRREADGVVVWRKSGIIIYKPLSVHIPVVLFVVAFLHILVFIMRCDVLAVIKTQKNAIIKAVIVGEDNGVLSFYKENEPSGPLY